MLSHAANHILKMCVTTAPEVWQEGIFLPDGHTISISDLYFAAHFAGLLRSIVGVAKMCDTTGLRLESADHVEANILIKAIGFEVNGGNERILGRSSLSGGSLVDRGIWTLYEAHPVANFSNSAFGSFLDAVPFHVQVICRYWQGPELYFQQFRRLCAGGFGITSRINHITSIQQATGLMFLVDGDEHLLLMMRAHVNAVSYTHLTLPTICSV